MMTPRINQPRRTSSSPWVKAFAVAVLSLAASQTAGVMAQSQWATSGNDIHNTNAGNVGVGTSSPGEKFHVSGARSRLNNILVGETRSGGAIPNGEAIQASGNHLVFLTNPSFDFTFGAPSASPNVVFKGSGNVGLGTTSPQSALHIQRNTDADAGFFLLNAGAGPNSRSIFLLGEAAHDARYGYVAYHGANHPTKANSTVLANAGAGGLHVSSLGGQSATGGTITFSTAPAAAQGGNEAVAERMRIDSNGNVGIGAANPGPFRLFVDAAAGGNIFNLRSSLDAGRNMSITYQDAPHVFQFSTDSAGGYAFMNGPVGVGTTAPATALHVVGDITVTGNISAKYQDMAEWVPSTQRLAAGTVVVLDPARANHVLASTTAYDTRVAGVISEKPGLALGEASEGKALVATAGRVRVKVSAELAPVRIGDLLVTSDVPGLAMKSEPIAVGGRKMHAPGTIIGKALEPLEKGTGEILVLLSLQ